MRNFAFLVLLLVSSQVVRGQATKPVATNAIWLDSVQRLALPQQVAAVRARAWGDTLLALRQPLGCLVRLPVATRPPTVPAATQLPQPKPVGFPLVYVLDGQPYFNNDAATVSQFQRALAVRPNRQVTLLHGVAAVAIYGSRAANGVVILASKEAAASP